MPELWWVTSLGQAQEVRVEIPEPEVASEVPALFYWSLWFPVFAVLTWFFLRFFGPGRQPSGYWPPGPIEEPSSTGDHEDH
jgi:hypothetical protein